VGEGKGSRQNEAVVGRLLMTLTWSRVLSVLLAVIYIIVGTVAGGAEVGFKVFAFVILPLACIWFADAMGGYTGQTWTGMPITAPSPGVIVCIVGWLVLLSPVVFVIIVYAET
jgi:hypothetical protein